MSEWTRDQKYQRHTDLAIATHGSLKLIAEAKRNDPGPEAPTEASDLYAKGCVLFEATTGFSPLKNFNAYKNNNPQLTHDQPRSQDVKPLRNALTSRKIDRFVSEAMLSLSTLLLAPENSRERYASLLKEEVTQFWEKAEKLM